MKVDLAYPRPPKFWHPLTGHICLQVWAIHRCPLSEVGVAAREGAVFFAALGFGPGVEGGSWRGILLLLRVHGVFLDFLVISLEGCSFVPEFERGHPFF